VKRAALLDRDGVRRYLTNLNAVVYDIQDPAISRHFVRFQLIITCIVVEYQEEAPGLFSHSLSIAMPRGPRPWRNMCDRGGETPTTDTRFRVHHEVFSELHGNLASS
jgi:hypothetical protein